MFNHLERFVVSLVHIPAESKVFLRELKIESGRVDVCVTPCVVSLVLFTSDCGLGLLVLKSMVLIDES